MGEIRTRVLMEPRGFIRIIALVLAIVTFATTGGYSGKGVGSVHCPAAGPATAGNYKTFDVTISYPFNLQQNPLKVKSCNVTATDPADAYVDVEVTIPGDFSPTSQWFVFVGVMAFLICLASIVFYVAFEAELRQGRENLVTMTDLIVTVLWAFLWLTAASSWAWGLNQVKFYSDPGEVCHLPPLSEGVSIKDAVCMTLTPIDYSSLNASVAFAFLSFVVWVGNVWFVYKETPYHDDGTPPQSDPPTGP